MSLCLALQSKNEIYMAGDSRVSVDIEGKKYRWNDNYSKIEQVGNYVIFKGSKADVMNKIVERFRRSEINDLAYFKQCCIDEYNDYRNREGAKFKPYAETNKMIVASLIGTIENNIPLVYFISDAVDFNIMKIELPIDKDLQDILLGVSADEAQKIYEDCKFNFDDSDNVFENYKKIYEGVTGDEIGGTLTVFRINNYGITNRQCGLMNSKYINELADYFLNNRECSGFANCTSLKINSVDILDSMYQIKGDYLSDNSVGISKLKVNELYVGTGGIRLDPSATISWNQVTSQPFIPSTAADVGALSTSWANGLSSLPSFITSTKITSTTVESPSIVGGTILGGNIISNSTINVTTDLRVGSKIYMNPGSFTSDLVFVDPDVKIYADPVAKSLLLTTNGHGGIYANGQRIDVAPVAVFG
ncbi:hypothetical protein Psfp_03889 [Pelotomaculum sp. FP]|uniref:hypothetical protein n=1 Tax=Pelotomaculum sp. FP TaxID=261474 RepID=UPI001065CFF2|nr:hypothetical protein [Pelotomaculum sp. FP]TEB11760.1 hypothetical protein Psfp_03889 [Pelotomaculum sp. FP]